MSRTRPLSPSQERARQVFKALRGLRQWTNGEIALRGDVARGYIESKSCGATAIDLEDIEILARAFDVDEHVFLMDPVSAQRWVLEHAPAAAPAAVASGRVARFIPELVDTGFTERQVRSTRSTIQFRPKPARGALRRVTAA